MLLLMVTNLFAGYRYTTHNLNLRTGPSTKYSAITIIPQGTSVTIDEDCDCKWIAVSYNGHIGYVSSKFLSKTFSKHSNYRNQYSRRQSQNRYYTNVDGYRVQSPTYSIHLMERLLSAEMGLIVIVEIDEELVLTMVVLQDGYNNYRK